MSENDTRFEIAHPGARRAVRPDLRDRRLLHPFPRHVRDAARGRSVPARTGIYQWSLKITEAAQPGMGHAARCAPVLEARRRAKSLGQTNIGQVGRGWNSARRRTFEYQSV